MNFTTEQSLIITRGDSFPMSATMKQGGKVVNITGAVITFEFKPKAGGAVQTITAAIVSATAGTVTFTPDAGMFDVEGEYLYRIKRVQNGKTYTHSKGKMRIESEW